MPRSIFLWQFKWSWLDLDAEIKTKNVSDEIYLTNVWILTKKKITKVNFVSRMIWKSRLCIQNLIMQGRCFIYKFSLFAKYIMAFFDQNA